MAGWTAAAIAGSAVLGAAVSSSAANKQANAAREATAAQQQALGQQIELNKPFYDVGVEATNKLASQTPYTPDAFNYEADPGYAFRFNEGMKGLNATAASRGGLISGNALRAATNYGQAAGSQEYSNAYDRYLKNNAQKFDAYRTNTGVLQNLAGTGQASANNQATAIGNFATSAGSNIIGAGNAGAAGMVGGANAISGGVGSYLSYDQNQNMLNAYNARTRSAYGSPSNMDLYGYGGRGQIPTPDYSIDTF
jgi:hypothetical protein